jgi:hypothetical protein
VFGEHTCDEHIENTIGNMWETLKIWWEYKKLKNICPQTLSPKEKK